MVIIILKIIIAFALIAITWLSVFVIILSLASIFKN